jgi:hypothetical protein
MRLAIDPFRLLLISLAGWLNQRQQDVIDYLQQENRVLREQLGGKRQCPRGALCEDHQGIVPGTSDSCSAKAPCGRVIYEFVLTIITSATTKVWTIG